MGKIVLILILANTGGAQNVEKRVYFSDIASCMAALKETKIVPNATQRNSDDNTWIGAATCGYENPADLRAYGK